MKKFCPQCGNVESKNQQLIKGLCKNCFLKNNPLLKGLKEIKIVVCPSCKSYLYKNKWHPKFSQLDDENLKKIISRIIPEKIMLQQEAKINHLGIVLKDGDKKSASKIAIELILNGTIYNSKLKEKYLLEIIKENSICNLCRKKNSSYYEAKIQIRPKNEKMLRMIKHNNFVITKEEETDFGYDLYLANKKDVSKIVSEIKKKFDVEVVLSNTLYGKKDGKEVYRTTALLRLNE